MPYLSNWQNDVFVSYAQVDDQLVSDRGAGWVCTLVDTLKIYLAQQIGRMGVLAVWRDLQLQGNAPLTPEILAAVRSSATLLVVLSEGYLQSQWCCSELDAFVAVAGRSSRRVFVVEAMPIEPPRRPEALRDLIGYPFWTRDRPDGLARPLGAPLAPSTDTEYFRRINRLAIELAGELRRMQSGQAPSASPPSAQPR